MSTRRLLSTGTILTALMIAITAFGLMASGAGAAGGPCPNGEGDPGEIGTCPGQYTAQTCDSACVAMYGTFGICDPETSCCICALP